MSLTPEDRHAFEDRLDELNADLHTLSRQPLSDIARANRLVGNQAEMLEIVRKLAKIDPR